MKTERLTASSAFAVRASAAPPRQRKPAIQDGWNRKGLIGENGIKKSAFWVLKSFYDEVAKSGRCPFQCVSFRSGDRTGQGDISSREGYWRCAAPEDPSAA